MRAEPQVMIKKQGLMELLQGYGTEEETAMESNQEETIEEERTAMESNHKETSAS